jgi:hypothetical protein
VKASFTAAIVVRSLWAELRSSWVVGVLVGWVVLRLVVCWPVSWDVVVAVDMYFPVIAMVLNTNRLSAGNGHG